MCEGVEAKIYIPLSSDKTKLRPANLRCDLIFISHLVQIKLDGTPYNYWIIKLFISHLVQIKPAIFDKLRSI